MTASSRAPAVQVLGRLVRGDVRRVVRGRVTLDALDRPHQPLDVVDVVVVAEKQRDLGDAAWRADLQLQHRRPDRGALLGADRLDGVEGQIGIRYWHVTLRGWRPEPRPRRGLTP